MSSALLYIAFVSLLLNPVVQGRCNAYPPIEHGVINYGLSSWSGIQQYEENTKATLSCKFGYKLSGPQTTICTVNGNWENELGECIPIAKSLLDSLPTLASLSLPGVTTPAVAFGSVLGKPCPPARHRLGTVTYTLQQVSPDLEKYPSGTVALLSCPGGQTVFGGYPEAVCKDGEWTNALGGCQPLP